MTERAAHLARSADETPRQGVFMRRRTPVGVVLLGMLWISGCTLAGDITPPPALGTAQAERQRSSTPIPAAQEIRLNPPAGPSNLIAGEAIYVEKCAGCHGASGFGDGELAGELQFPPSALGDEEVARLAAPADWYTIVTVGNLERFMPGFASLTDQERWDVVGYALSLSATADQIRRGEELFDAECAGCHAGEGPAQNYGTGRLLVDRSADQLFEAISEGVGGGMPAFGEALSLGDRWSLALFLQRRDLTAGVSHPEPIVDVEPAQLARGEVKGTIHNGTTGSSIPAGLEVTLRGFDGDEAVIEQKTLAGADGSFIFGGLEVVPGRLFFASLEYKGVPYRSEMAHLLSDQPVLDLPLTVYEPTSDIDQLRVQRLHLLFDFSVEGVARVLELWALSNPTDRIMVDSEGVVQISLPDGAVNLQFEDQGEDSPYLPIENGFADPSPVLPGSGTGDLAFGFDMPFDGTLEFIQQLAHRVEAVIILLPPDGPRLSGEGVQDLGIQDMGGISMHNYALGAHQPGEALTFQLSPGIADRLGALEIPNLAMGAAVLGIALVLTGLWWFRGGSRTTLGTGRTAAPLASEALLIAIARLDDDYQAGRIDEQTYRDERAALKRRALEQMQRREGRE